MANKEIDRVTGAETTGHEWDGIKELNKPLPRWWLWTFYVSIAWSIAYMVVYPAWPTLTGYTPGIWGYSQRATVTAEVEAAKAAQGSFRRQLGETPLEKVKDNPELFRFAVAGGQAAFKDNCAPCHGRGAQGAVGYPNLNDDDWLWGGSIADIEKTIRFGIRSGHSEARESAMPRYGVDAILQRGQIDDLAEYVLNLAGKGGDAKAVERAKPLFQEQCVACHGPAGKGDKAQGAPDLTDAIWLYGSSKEAIVESIASGRGGKMPSFAERLDAVTIKALAVYVHGLGGGK
jgi:cytochrome c oxidase cbb3-type subunit 3